VRFEHPFAAAEIEGTLAGTLSQTQRQRWIVQETGERSSKSSCVAGAESETRVAQDLSEGAEIGGDDRQGPQHIFRDNQTENFSAKRRNHNDGRLRERGMELRTVETAGEANLHIQFRFAGKTLQRIAFRAIADNQEFERLSLLAQDARSFEQEPHTFRGNEPALKRKNRWNAPQLEAWRPFGGFKPMRNSSRLREKQLAAQPRRWRDVSRNVGAEKSPDER